MDRGGVRWGGGLRIIIADTKILIIDEIVWWEFLIFKHFFFFF